MDTEEFAQVKQSAGRNETSSPKWQSRLQLQNFQNWLNLLRKGHISQIFEQCECVIRPDL